MLLAGDWTAEQVLTIFSSVIVHPPFPSLLPLHLGTKPRAVTPHIYFIYYLGERDFVEVRVGMLGQKEGQGRGHDAPLIKKNDTRVVPDNHPDCSPPPPSHSNRTTLVMRRVKSGEAARGGFINQVSQINCYEVSPINSPFGFNNLGGRLNNLCRDLSFIEESVEGGRRRACGGGCSDTNSFSADSPSQHDSYEIQLSARSA